jgi:hypothetical protein
MLRNAQRDPKFGKRGMLVIQMPGKKGCGMPFCLASF